jgi:NFU1 iron-sulfur cluster scaffold homolog, mitochondrial
METTKIPVNVYAESTPNPATMKFVSNKLLVENGASVEYTDIDKAKESALASKLFNRRIYYI